MIWEYKVKYIYSYVFMDKQDAVDEFKRLGESGWELVAVIFNPVTNCRELYYKREKKSV